MRQNTEAKERHCHCRRCKLHIEIRGRTAWRERRVWQLGKRSKGVFARLSWRALPLEKVRRSRDYGPDNVMKPIRLKTQMKRRERKLWVESGVLELNFAEGEPIKMWSWEGMVPGKLECQLLNRGQEITNTVIQNESRRGWRGMLLDRCPHQGMWRINPKSWWSSEKKSRQSVEESVHLWRRG